MHRPLLDVRIPEISAEVALLLSSRFLRNEVGAFECFKNSTIQQECQ